MRLTDEQIDILWQEFGPDAGWRSEDGIPLSHAVLLSLLAEVRASRAARAESEGTRECVFGDPIPPDDLPPRESIHDAASSESEGTRLDGTLYERCPLCLARTAQATRLAHEAAPASRDGQGETPTCRAGLPDGRRCSFHAVPGSMFCWSHGGPDEGTGGGAQ